jgi:hypothetical protein
LATLNDNYSASNPNTTGHMLPALVSQNPDAWPIVRWLYFYTRGNPWATSTAQGIQCTKLAALVDWIYWTQTDTKQAAALANGPSVSSSAPTSAAVVLGPQALAALTSPRGGDSQFERTLASGDTTLSDVGYVDGEGSTSGRTIALGGKGGSGVFFPNEVRFFTSTNGGGEWRSLNTSTHTLYTNGSLTFVPGSATGYACSFLPPTSACDQ